MAIDNGAPASSFWLTGSQAFRMMELAQESLAGRTAIIHMSSLSQHELYGAGENIKFSVDLETLKHRSKMEQRWSCRSYMRESGWDLCRVIEVDDTKTEMFFILVIFKHILTEMYQS